MARRGGNESSCSTCLKTFRTKANLTRHMSTHNLDAKVKCEICARIFRNPRTLSNHIKRLHTNRDRAICDVCHRGFFSPDNLRRHISAVHCTITRPRFPCGFPACDKSYLTKADVSKHIKIEHAENPARFPCTLCGKEFRSKHNLDAHISTHTTEKPYSCFTCGRHFSNAYKLKIHEVTHLEQFARRIFKCEICDQTFLLKGYLQRHIQAVHENRRNHPCTFCDKRFSRSDNLRRHVEATHTGNEKIHSCDKCNFRSHSKGTLAHHAKRHNPANRRECYFCQKQFFYFSKLVTHCRRHTLEQFK
ncbi:PR domain zinc finger protein 5-like [Folsomia candida]|uniref:PR domain zinc finger protein 5-like n=1 Tax=Folsomia candida TaxID=158441 RepID=UPI001604B199|nr:PR domain zinc finger protein 5-like [Folsomia candida]